MIRDSGQSLTEFAAAAAVLGMLMLGCISIAGIQEGQRRAVVAAREAAFQGVWNRDRRPATSLRNEISQAHFDDVGLGNATGSARIVRPGDIELVAETGAAPGSGRTAVAFLLRPLQAAGGFFGGAFDLDDQGFHTGVVSASFRETSRMPEPFRGLPLGLRQPFAMLGDDWSAGGPQHVARRAGGLVPTSLLSPLAAVWRPLSAPLSLFEPSLRELCFGLIEPDRIPEDRLSPGAAQRPPTCL